jgi:hypothetical protein
METALQIVAFNIPYPPDYGGIIDIFYKVKALSKCGVSIYLHCFEYDRPRAEELEEFCAKVFYYKRKSGIRYQLSDKPYIAITRENSQLLNNLLSVDFPILFEGLHTCFYLNHPALKNHIRLVRTHNIEHEYYRNLQLAEHHFFKKIYFGMEAKKLARFEQVLKNASELLCISPNDNFYFDHHFGHSHFVPAFHPFSEIKSKPGKGRYVLFHGNLSVAENFQAAEFLVTQVLGHLNHEVIIAGKNPTERLIQKINQHSNIQLIANPDNEQMENLIKQAHICLLPTFQDTGLKLKLLASLFSGRFCIVNTPMVHKTGLEHLCHIAETSQEMIRLTDELFKLDFPTEEIEKRKLILEDTFSNRQNALKIIRLIEEIQTKS